MTMYKSLMELLQKLPKDTQDRISALATEYAKGFCERYSVTLPEHQEAVRLYNLSKRVKSVFLNQSTIKPVDPNDINCIEDIETHYYKIVCDMLDENLNYIGDKKENTPKEIDWFGKIIDALKKCPIIRGFIGRIP